eukprot:gene14521-17146_t
MSEVENAGFYATRQTTPLQRACIYDRLLNRLGARRLNHLYKISSHDFKLDPGSVFLLLGYSRDSPYLFIITLFPNHIWLPWLFNRIPLFDYPNNPKIHQLFIIWYSERYCVPAIEFFSVKRAQLVNAGVSLSHEQYLAALSVVFPEITWHPWLFTHPNPMIWKDPKVIAQIGPWILKEFNITIEQFPMLSLRNNHRYNFVTLYKYLGPKHYDVAVTLFPNHPWDKEAFSRMALKSYCLDDKVIK